MKCNQEHQSNSKYCWQHQCSGIDKVEISKQTSTISKHNTKHNSFRSGVLVEINYYFSVLPTELLMLIFLELSSDDLYWFLKSEYPNNNSVFNRLLSNRMFWKRVWERDISSLVKPPNYIDDIYVIYDYETAQSKSPVNSTYGKIHNLIFNSYDKLLYSIVSNRAEYSIALYAAGQDELSIATEMMKRGAEEINKSILYAMLHGSKEILELLLKSPTDHNRLDKSFLIQLAEVCGRTEIIELIQRIYE